MKIRGATTYPAKCFRSSIAGSVRPIGAQEQNEDLPMFASARGQAVAFLPQPGGGEENTYMIAVMSYYFYQRTRELIYLPVHAPQHGFKVFPVLFLCCRSFPWSTLVDFPLRPSFSFSRKGGGHNILVLLLLVS